MTKTKTAFIGVAALIIGFLLSHFGFKPKPVEVEKVVEKPVEKIVVKEVVRTIKDGKVNYDEVKTGYVVELVKDGQVTQTWASPSLTLRATGVSVVNPDGTEEALDGELQIQKVVLQP